MDKNEAIKFEMTDEPELLAAPQPNAKGGFILFKNSLPLLHNLLEVVLA